MGGFSSTPCFNTGAYRSSNVDRLVISIHEKYRKNWTQGDLNPETTGFKWLNILWDLTSNYGDLPANYGEFGPSGTLVREIPYDYDFISNNRTNHEFIPRDHQWAWLVANPLILRLLESGKVTTWSADWNSHRKGRCKLVLLQFRRFNKEHAGVSCVFSVCKQAVFKTSNHIWAILSWIRKKFKVDSSLSIFRHNTYHHQCSSQKQSSIAWLKGSHGSLTSIFGGWFPGDGFL